MKKIFFIILILQFYCKSLDSNAKTILKDSKVITIDTGIANLYLIPSKIQDKWILIDNGDSSDEKDLIPRLKAVGVNPENILVNIITHGHADHGGNSKYLQSKFSIPILAGLGDKAMHESGHNPEVLNAKGLFAHILKWFLNPNFSAYTADLYISKTMSLEKYGIEGKVVPSKSHTPGSLVVLLDTKEAFVGDLIRGSLGNKNQATEHFYMDDFELAHNDLLAYVNEGYVVFYPGHWGPLDATGVKEVADTKH